MPIYNIPFLRRAFFCPHSHRMHLAWAKKSRGRRECIELYINFVRKVFLPRVYRFLCRIYTRRVVYIRVYIEKNVTINKRVNSLFVCIYMYWFTLPYFSLELGSFVQNFFFQERGSLESDSAHLRVSAGVPPPLPLPLTLVYDGFFCERKCVI